MPASDRNERNTNEQFRYPWLPWVLKALPAVVLFFYVYSCFFTVGVGQRGVVTTWGQLSDEVRMPGLHWKWTGVQQATLINVQVQKYEAAESAASRDLQTTTTSVALNYYIDPSTVTKLFSSIGTEDALIVKVVEPIMSNAVKSVTAQFDAEQLIANRDQVRALIAQHITDDLKAYEVDVRGVNITNFAFSGDYAQAIEKKQVAQQKAQQATYELQQVQTESQQKVANAKADADAIVLRATANAKAFALQSQSLTQANLLKLAIDKWNGVYPAVLTMGGNEKGNPLGQILNLPPGFVAMSKPLPPSDTPVGKSDPGSDNSPPAVGQQNQQ